MLVGSASKISDITGIPQSLIGATIVSLATTLPELNVVIFSSLGGHNSLAIGNSVGSIIFNLTFIVGIVLLFTKNNIKLADLGNNFFIMFGTIMLIYILSLFNVMNKIAGMILLCVFLLYFINNIIDANKKGVVIESIQSVPKPIYKAKKYKLCWVIICFCVSSFLVSLGAKLLVSNGERIARILNVSEHIIGVTIIAMGTSLPEVVTAITSIRQKNTGIAIGNTIGANILSSTLLLGISAILEPNKLVLHSNITNVALPLIMLSSVIIYIPIHQNKKQYRLQGLLLIILFVIYYCTVLV